MGGCFRGWVGLPDQQVGGVADPELIIRVYTSPCRKPLPIVDRHAEVAQQVERVIWDHEAAGSRPARLTRHIQTPESQRLGGSAPTRAK